MCDNDTAQDMIEISASGGGLSRRRFGALSLGAGVISLLRVAGAADRGAGIGGRHQKTPDGIRGC